MKRELIINALKSACGNKNLDFQVALRNSQLYIYVSHQPEHRVNYLLLKDNVTSIANLCDSLELWLYVYLAGETEPEWQTFVKLPAATNADEDDTVGSSQALNNCHNASGIVLSTEDFAGDIGDTGLLQDRGMVHGCALTELNLSILNTSETPTVLQIANPNLEDKILARYCFVSDRELLKSNKIFPKRKIKRLVIFFHHFELEDRYKLLPILDGYFQGDRQNDLELPLVLQPWFEEIKKLNTRDRQLLAIWLSRYCFASHATLKQFETARDVVFVKSDKPKGMASLRHIEDSLISDKNNQTITSVKQLNKSHKTSIWFFSKLILLGAGILTTAILIILKFSNNFTSDSSQYTSSFCNNTIGSSDYCRLAVNLVGENKLANLSGSLFPLTKVTEAVATYNCEKYANFKAGATDLTPEQTPVISSYGEKIFPHIYVVEVRQKNRQQSGNIKVGCVYTIGRGQRSPKLLAADVIPQSWPLKRYRKINRLDFNLFGIYTNSIKLGLYTIFASWGKSDRY